MNKSFGANLIGFSRDIKCSIYYSSSLTFQFSIFEIDSFCPFYRAK